MSEVLHISQSLNRIEEKLNHLQKVISAKEKPFLNLNEASEYLGLSKQTLYHYTSTGTIPFHKLNDRRVYFDINDLNDFILNKKNRFKSNDEIETEAVTKVITGRK